MLGLQFVSEPIEPIQNHGSNYLLENNFFFWGGGGRDGKEKYPSEQK